MKPITKLFALLTTVLALGVITTGCKEKTTEEKLADDLKKSAEKAGDAAKDAGKAVEDAVKK
jgi:hypothetical protein